MSDSKPVAPLSVKDLFNSNTQYVVPIYQRNYAWGASEIEQLIQDIYDASGNGESRNIQDKYYLGSLVVYKRELKGNNQQTVYETIDGQQRHTTLSILLAYLKNLKTLDDGELNELQVNLCFDSRPKSTRALEDIYLNDANSKKEEPSIHAAYDIIERFFKIKGLNKAFEAQAFCNYLLNQVTILRVIVPQGTDLNHYFEIMNNRGEQLEKHEVLKAKFMATLESGEETNAFSAIWDACSDMKRYAQMGFKSEDRRAVFGNDWRTIPSSFNAIQSKLGHQKEVQRAMTLRKIIENKSSHSNNDDEEREKEQRFGSIIDFSNFLLHVLKLIVAEDSVSLDDKKLLDAFISKEGRLKVDAKEFAFELLKFRILFDSYIIKPDMSAEERKWSLQKLTSRGNDSSLSPDYPSSFSSEQNPSVNEKIRMILAMFHVSHSSHVYKRWLNHSLAILRQLAKDNSKLHVNGNEYLNALEKLSNEFLDDISKEDGQLNEKVFHRGTGVQNFVFNLLDYRLWREFTAGKSFDGKGLDNIDIKKHFDGFQFSQSRTSVEHYFPQTDPSGADKMGEDVHRFGNLCLISQSSNSRLSNYYPEGKKSFYQENNRAESLKQAIMLSYDEWGPEGVGYENILKHEAAMLKVLCNQ